MKRKHNKAAVGAGKVWQGTVVLSLMACLAFSFVCNKASAQQDTSICKEASEKTYAVAVGGSNNLDTYLSPLEKYRGTGLRFIHDYTHDSAKHPLTYHLTGDAGLEYCSNRSGKAKEYSAHYNMAYGITWHIDTHIKDLNIAGGAMAEGWIGGCYNNAVAANNPAQGYATVNIGAMLTADYRFTLFGKAMKVGYEVRMPVVGVMFSPNYGQSYYEIFYRGNYDHNIVFTSVATPQIRQQLSIDYPLTQCKSLRVGYLGDIRQAEPNNIKQHQYYNAVVVGLVIKR